MSYPNFTPEIQICPPSLFVRQHQLQILPTWTDLIVSTLIVLQPSRCPLTAEHSELETEKERLREQFLRWAFPRVCQLRDRDYLTDLIDPRSGYPLFSTPGEIRHDDVAMIAAVLEWEIVAVGNCRAIVHPQWGTAVYPGIIFSTASQTILQSILEPSEKSEMSK